MFSFDPKDGFYALEIVPKQRDFLTANARGQLYRLVSTSIPLHSTYVQGSYLSF
jgi:hypothetical protein